MVDFVEVSQGPVSPAPGPYAYPQAPTVTRPRQAHHRPHTHRAHRPARAATITTEPGLTKLAHGRIIQHVETTGSARPNARHIDLGDGVEVPAEIAVRATDVSGYAVDLLADYNEHAGRYVVRSAEVHASSAAEVTGEAIRSIPVATILREGVISALGSNPLPDGEPAIKTGPTGEALRAVARIYRIALVVGAAPTQAVAIALSIPRSTAGRWVTRARDRGLLTVVDPRASRLA